MPSAFANYVVTLILTALISSHGFQTTKAGLSPGAALDRSLASSFSDDDFLEVDGPKAQLLEAIGYDSIAAGGDAVPRFAFALRGTDDSNSKKANIISLADDLSGYVLPLEKPSKWTLLYTEAPDLLGFQGGPLSQLVSIRQYIQSSQQLEIVLTYKPSENIVRLTDSLLSDIQQDRLEQAVLFGYKVGPMNKVDLQLKGTRIEGSRLGSLPVIQSPGNAGLPLGGFSIVYNDGDLRIDRTTQGDFLFIYKRTN